MRWVGFAIAMCFFLGVTVSALMASTVGWGLTGKLDKPVSVRQGSTGRTGGFFYFSGRTHSGGGYRGGK